MGYDLETTLIILSMILPVPVVINLVAFMVLRVVKSGHE